VLLLKTITFLLFFSKAGQQSNYLTEALFL